MILVISNSFANQLESYQDIEKAIDNGNKIVVATNFSKCKTSMPVSGQFVPSEIMIVNNSIIFSVTHFTTNNPAYKGMAVNEYTTYTLNKDDSFYVNTQVISLSDYKVTPFATNICLLNQDVKYFTAGN